MPLPKVGDGYQLNDGNLSEPIIYATPAPQTATATATLTAAQILGGMLVASPGTSAAAYTLPTVAALETALSGPKIGTTIELDVVNLGTSSGVITWTTNTGWTLVGLATIAISLHARFKFRKTSATTWTSYRVG